MFNVESHDLRFDTGNVALAIIVRRNRERQRQLVLVSDF